MSQLLADIEHDSVVKASGIVSLFEQFAHPLVAAGVASTGKFADDPRARLERTSRSLHRLATGSPKQVAKLSGHLAKVHASIRGELSETVGDWKAGTSYAASDPELLLWVYASLVVSRIRVFSELIRPVSDAECQEYYESTRTFGEQFGVTDAVRPANYAELATYYEEMLEKLAVGKDARVLTTALLQSLPATSAMSTATAWLLPAALREAYGLPWNRREATKARIYKPLLVRALPTVERTLELWQGLRNKLTT